ncbi:ADP-ribosylglycohydrolase family protein [Candidatus Saccharibacteria bacterium]|nr:ADP-ribosylglycohydrolase family protein [Candidatus Saccharibacteria bacterium]MBQ6409647.1 ADP-ribosylglycohydrolase family protein [Candidatus Saccharibacteria bacterium]
MKLDYRDRARGMLVGLAVGDALGAPVEFLPGPSDVYIKDMGERIANFHENMRLPSGVWTDDTEMALCLADSLLASGGYDSYDIMMKFVAWCDNGYRTYDGKPAVDVGIQTARAIGDFKTCPVIFKDDVAESAGNGAIMRLAPVVIATAKFGNIDFVSKMAGLSCRETHNSKTAEMVTRIFAEILFVTLKGGTKQEISAYVDKKMIIEKDSDNLRNLGGYIVDTFAIALFGLMNFDSFKDGMMAVIRLGGDTDTNGAVYGQLAGAYYGYSAIPKEWREEVYLASELVDIADKLANMEKCPIIRTRFEGDEYFEENN